MKLKTIKLNRIVSLTVIASLVSIIVLPFVSHEVVADYIQPLWQQSSNSVYTDLTSVGIGDSTPDTGTSTLLLDVEGAIGATEYCDENGNNCTAATSLGGSSYTAGTGLNLTGTTFSIADTAATAGSYTNADVTVNAQGQITAVANGTDNDTIVSPADANGAVQFNNSGSFGGDAGNLFWDNTSKELGIGTNNPNQKLAVVGDSDFNGNFAVGANGIVNANEVINVEENFNVDATTYQIRSTTTQTSPLLTGDRISYGAYFDVIDNKTEDTATGRDSDATAGYFRARSNNASPTFRTMRGVQAQANNYSNQTTNLGTLIGGDFTAQNLDSAGRVATATAVNAHTRGDSTALGTSSIATAYGVNSTIYAYETDIGTAYGGAFRAQTNNGDLGNITNAYGVYGDAYADSNAGATITTGRGGYFTVRKDPLSPNMTNAYGISILASGGTNVYGASIDANTGTASGTNVYGIRVDTDDATANINYGLYIDAAGATTNYGIYGQRGNWILADAAGDVGIGDTTPDLALRLDVAGQIGATEYCNDSGTECYTSAQMAAAPADIWVNTTGDTMTGTLTMTGQIIDQPQYIDIQAGTGNGIRFWNASTGAYEIAMGDDADYHYGPITSHSIKSNMGGANRGFTWGTKGNVPTAALTNTGRMQIADDMHVMGGNLGIGTNAQTYALHINTDDPVVWVGDSNSTLRNAQVKFATGGGVWSIGNDNTLAQNDFVFKNTDDTASMMIERATGNVGIGTVSPGTILQLGGDNGGQSNYMTIGKGWDSDSGINWQRAGNIDAQIRVNNSENFIFESNPNGTGANADFVFKNNTVNRARLTAGGLMSIGPSVPTERLMVEGNIYAVDGAIGSTSNSVVHLARPSGASYSGSGTLTGAIKVTLPQSWTNTMLKMDIEVYDYVTNESFTVKVGGYTYSTGSSWYNTTAQIIGNKLDRDFTVRFGHDGTNVAIWIGETTSTWSYPKVSVMNFMAAHSASAYDDWDDGWSVAIDNSFTGDTMTRTHDNNLVGLWLANGNDIYNSNSAKVGIGIAAPVSDLHVYENTANTGGGAGITIEQAGTGDARLGFGVAAADWAIGIDNNDGDRFKIGAGGLVSTSTAMTIETTGDIGFGIANPAHPLHIYDPNPSIRLGDSDSTSIDSTVTLIEFYDRNTARAGYMGYSSASNGIMYFINQSTTGDIRMGTNNGTDFTIEHTGDVGIGTNTPSSKLHVVGGPINADDGLIIETLSSDPASPADGRLWLIN